MRQAAATMVSIRSQRMSRTIKAKRYNTLAACIRRSIWNDIAYPLAVDRRFPLRQARNDLPHAQATDLRLAMISNANFRFRPNSRGHRDDGCRAPQVEPESPRRAADPYHRLVA